MPSAETYIQHTHTQTILDALEAIQGFGPPNKFRGEWETICQMPTRLGGLGLQSAVRLAGLAFLSSMTEASALMRSASIQPRFQKILPLLEAWLAPPPKPIAEQLAPAAAVGPHHPPSPVLPILQSVSTTLLSFVDAIKVHRQEASHEKFAENLMDNPRALPKIPSDLAEALSCIL
jgi:hypothetical protein